MTANHIGDIASILGVLISLVGFGLTVWGIRRSTTAAKEAEKAAKSARDKIRIFESVVDFTSAISILEEIKKLHRQGDWGLLPEKYSFIRKTLISIKSINQTLSNEHKSTIQNTILNLSKMEKEVELNIENKSTLKASKFNSVLSADIDGLIHILTELKFTSTGEKK